MAFARAIKQSRRVVLAAHRESGDGQDERVKLPAPEFWIGAAAIGHLLHDVDGDGIVRHGLRDRRIAARALPSLSQAAVALALGQDPVPSDTRRFVIDYRWANTPIPTIPVDDVIQDRFDPGAVAGRIVFIGGTASRFQDVWTTPLGPNQSGLYIQALAARTLLAEHAAASPQTQP
jgi:CHASE2 domain-containing sensor protein